MPIQSSPDLSRLDLRRLFSDPPTLNQARKFVLWCWGCRVVELPRSGSHAPQTLCNSEAKRLWRSCGTWAWAWAQGEDQDGFEVDYGRLAHWSWHQGVVRTLI